MFGQDHTGNWENTVSDIMTFLMGCCAVMLRFFSLCATSVIPVKRLWWSSEYGARISVS